MESPNHSADRTGHSAQFVMLPTDAQLAGSTNCAMNSVGDLARRIRLGEDSTLEFKRVFVTGSRVSAPSRSVVADELCGFANGRGGDLVLGVEDSTRAIVGIPPEALDMVEAWVREICCNSLNPPLFARVRKIELPNGANELVPLVLVEVERSLFVHESPGGFFVRLGSSIRRLPPDLLARRFQQRSQSRIVRFDESAVPDTMPCDLDYALTRRFLREHPGEEGVPESDARKLSLIVDTDGEARLTLAGVLLCTRSPQRWLRHACVQAVSYAGERTDLDCQINAREIGGPIDAQVAATLHFVRRDMLARATNAADPSEHPQYSVRAVLEALVNAIAHRDYSVTSARIRLHLFGDRLELYVPGTLEGTLRPDSLHLRQASRNQLIASLLSRCPAPTGSGRTRIMDRRGDGVPIIRKECRKMSGKLPEYTLIDDSELRLVIPAVSASG